MKFKVCGMKYPDNIEQLSQLPIDYMGLIFYSKSPRYIEDLDPSMLEILPENIKRVGVFVNEEHSTIEQNIKRYNLNLVQLHGAETVDDCRIISQFCKVIKVFSIANIEDLDKTYEYANVCDYFLFDTKTPQYGGSGEKFDWDILQAYKLDKPYFLSGGISTTDLPIIKKMQDSRLQVFDLNSRFELKPGYKDIQLIQKFIKDIRS